jgi:hypothetical protein
MAKQKHIALALFLLLAFLSGLARQFFAPGEVLSRVDVPFLLVSLFLTFIWFRVDSEQLGYRRSPILNVMVLAITFLALPYYFFRSRGFLRGSIATVLFLVVAVAYSMLQVGGECAVYYGLQS